MKNLFIIPMLLLTLGTVRAQPADSLEDPLSFYPIQIGNQWDYYYPGGFEPPPTKYYTKVSVTADTLINDNLFKILSHRSWYEEFWVDPDVWILYNEYYTYERIDSLTGNVYAWAGHFEEPSEILIDSLFLNIKEYEFQSYRYLYRFYQNKQTMLDDAKSVRIVSIFEKDIFGTMVETRHYEPWAFNAIPYELSRNIGITGFSLGGEALDEIVYARINGEEFGERLLTNLDEPEEMPVSVRLHPNYPNPFNPSTTLCYDLDEPGTVLLEVFDLTGRRVALLADGPAPAGRHTAAFNAAGLASGVYMARLTAGGTVQHRKMLLVR
jgi:hypothetical protein